MTTTFNFKDGNGPVPAHKHPNGGGWVAFTATVAATAFVGPNALVYGNNQAAKNTKPQPDYRAEKIIYIDIKEDADVLMNNGVRYVKETK